MRKNIFALLTLCFFFVVFGVQAQEHKTTKVTKISKPTEWKPGRAILINTADKANDIPAGIVELVYTKEGNLVLYAMYADRNAVWSAITDSEEEQLSAKLSFQADGNFVLYKADGSVAWASNCHGQGGTTIKLIANPGKDKAVILDKKGKEIWGTPVTE